MEIGQICVIATCNVCKEDSDFVVNKKGFEAWQSRTMLIQEALPELTAPERELLISGICPSCWKMMFGGGR